MRQGHWEPRKLMSPACETAGRKRALGMSMGLTVRLWVEFSHLGVLGNRECFRRGTSYASPCESGAVLALIVTPADMVVLSDGSGRERIVGAHLGKSGLRRVSRRGD